MYNIFFQLRYRNLIIIFVSYRFRQVLHRSTTNDENKKKKKKMDRSILRIIYWTERGGTPLVKEYNGLKQRLMKIGIKNLVYLTINIYLEILEKNWFKYDIFPNIIMTFFYLQIHCLNDLYPLSLSLDFVKNWTYQKNTSANIVWNKSTHCVLQNYFLQIVWNFEVKFIFLNDTIHIFSFSYYVIYIKTNSLTCICIDRNYLFFELLIKMVWMILWVQNIIRSYFLLTISDCQCIYKLITDFDDI